MNFIMIYNLIKKRRGKVFLLNIFYALEKVNDYAVLGYEIAKFVLLSLDRDLNPEFLSFFFFFFYIC